MILYINYCINYGFNSLSPSLSLYIYIIIQCLKTCHTWISIKRSRNECWKFGKGLTRLLHWYFNSRFEKLEINKNEMNKNAHISFCPSSIQIPIQFQLESSHSISVGRCFGIVWVQGHVMWGLIGVVWTPSFFQVSTCFFLYYISYL